VQQAISSLAIIIIGIDNCERLVDHLPGCQDSLAGSPGLFPANRHGKPFRQVREILADIGNGDGSLVSPADYIFELSPDIFPDHKNHLVEPGADRIAQLVGDGAVARAWPGGNVLQVED